MSADSDDLDWFEKDENEILDDFAKKTNIGSTSLSADSESEFIKGNTTINNDYLKQQRLRAAVATQKSNNEISIAELRKISKMDPLDAFFYVNTLDIKFFVKQIFPNDSQERWGLYLKTINIIGDLELPYFYAEILTQIAKDVVLLEHFRYYITNIFNKNYKKNDNLLAIANILDMIQILFLRIYQLKVMTPECLEIISHIQKLFHDHQSSLICELDVVKEFQKHLELITLMSDKELNKKNDLITENDEMEIYPTLDELLKNNCEEVVELANLTNVSNEQSTENNIENYINKQLNLLRDDFISPLRALINDLQNQLNVDKYNICLYDNVEIVVNSNFINSNRHELLFVNISNAKCKLRSLKSLKVGALLCFTSRKFDDLIFATVTYTDSDILKNGYVGIEIVRQFNIGNIYNKEMLMFETPTFFEPYANVYNYLKNCSIKNFPMKHYILDGQTNVAAPSYLSKNTVYKYDKSTFKPRSNKLPLVKNLNLNQPQLAAFVHALSNEFALIHGPPGTGKTHLTVEIVKTLIENAQKPIILITYTNESLDKFLIKISSCTNNIVRFGTQSRNPEIQKYTINKIGNKYLVNPRLKRLHYIVKTEFNDKFLKLQKLHDNFDGTQEYYEKILMAQKDLRYIGKKLQVLSILFQYYIASKSDIIAMTTTFASKTNFLFRLLKSSIVVFEEAAEILESHVISCLTPFTQHVIMIGDHLQLKPFTSIYQPNMLSLFERLINQNIKLQTLTTQYRMRPCIAELLHPTIYKELKNANIVEEYPLVRIMKKNLYFYTHQNKETTKEYEPSICNSFESQEIVELAENLIEFGKYKPEDIVILSPYAKQVECIEKKLLASLNKELHKISVQTVDSFQGLEANIVLLSLVRNNKMKQIGFLNQINRICVALSRAKYGLYIIGNIDLLADRNKIWKDIKEKLIEQDAIGNEFPYDKDIDN